MSRLEPTSVVGVVGAGTMGAGIAHVAAGAGHRVLLYDVERERAAGAVSAIADRLDAQVAKGRIDASVREAIIERLTVANEIKAFAEAALVVETIVESLDVKRQLLVSLEDTVAPGAVLASNTSALSITAIASALAHPDRFLGLHFFNPPPVMPLVEVVSGAATDPAVARDAAALLQAWGKVPVHAASTPGFIVNRVARPFYGESLRALEEGIAEPATIDVVLREAGGFRMGPLELTDLIGQDVNEAVNRAVWEGFGYDPRYAPSRLQHELVEAGRLGRKSGRGFYDYENGSVPAAPVSAPPAEQPYDIRPVGDLGPLAALLPLADAAGIDIRPPFGPAHDGQGYLELGALARLMLTDGRLATELSARSGRPVILVDAAQDLATAPRVAIAAGEDCPPPGLADAVGLFQAIGKEVSVLKDVAGMLVMRTVAMLVNEAADVVGTGVASPENVDLAMRKGANYPVGPLQWGDQLGPAFIVRVLDNLAAVYRDSRYRACPLLRRRALASLPLAGASRQTKETT